MPFRARPARLRLHATLLILALVAAAIATSSASANWTPTQDLPAAAGGSARPVVAVGAGGHSSVLFRDGTSNALNAVTREPGGAWSSPALLTAPGSESATYSTVVDAEGNVTALWAEYTMTTGPPPMYMPIAGPSQLFTATRPAGGSWGASTRISTPGASFTKFVLALGADGRVAAAWDEGAGIRASTRALGGSWSTPAEIPSSGILSGGLDAVIAPDGRLTVVWDVGVNGIRAAMLPAGGSWSSVATVSSNGQRPVATVDGLGRVTLAWRFGTRIFAADGAADNTWTVPEQVSVNGALSYYLPDVASDSAGNVTVSWPQAVSVSGQTVNRQMTTTRPSGGTWSTPAIVGTGESGGLAVAAGANGRVTATWRSQSAGLYHAQSAWRNADGTWYPGVTLSGAGTTDLVSLALDADGDPLVVWGESNVIKARSFDTTAPRLRDLTVPTSAAPGAPITFSVSPFDLGSGLGTTTWDFGDGTTATGASVTHTYAAAGSWTVTLTVTDAFGNARTSTRSITVAGAPVPAPVAPGTPAAAATPPAASTTPAPDTATVPREAPAPAACASRRTIKMRWKLPRGARVSRINVTVNGRVVARLKGKARSHTISFRGRGAGRVKVGVSASTARGKRSTTRTYELCSRQDKPGASPALMLKAEKKKSRRR